MIVYTSTFRKSGSDPKAVSIALKSPGSWKGREYKKLAPTPAILKCRDNPGEYEIKFKKKLARLSPFKVLEELKSSPVLLCYEDEGEFCHRHIVARWFKAAGIEAVEYKGIYCKNRKECEKVLAGYPANHNQKERIGITLAKCSPRYCKPIRIRKK